MAGVNTRLARFIMEAAPPQFVSVMRRRTSKMLDTITEEDRVDMAAVAAAAAAASTSRASSASSVKGTIISMPCSSSGSFTATNSGYFHNNGVDRSMSRSILQE